MTALTSTVKFDQELWDIRSAAYNATQDDDTTRNPYLPTSSAWAAWEAGRAFGLGRVSQARGCFLNIQTTHGNVRISFDELAAAPTCAPVAVAYCFGAR